MELNFTFSSHANGRVFYVDIEMNGYIYTSV